MASLPALPRSYGEFCEVSKYPNWAQEIVQARQPAMVRYWADLLNGYVLKWVAGPNLGDHSWMYGGSIISLPLLGHPAHVSEVDPLGYNRIRYGPSSSNSNPLQSASEFGSRPLNPYAREFKPRNLEITNINDGKNEPSIAAQCTVEANPQSVHAAQKNYDVPPIEANLAPLEAELKLPPKEHAEPEKPKFEPWMARLEVGEATTREEARHNPTTSTETSFLVGDIMIPTSKGLELKNNNGEAQNSCEGNSDDRTTELEKLEVGEATTREEAWDHLATSTKPFFLVGSIHVIIPNPNGLEVKNDNGEAQNSRKENSDDKTILKDSEIEDEQEEEKREDETEHGHSRSEKKKKHKRRIAAATGEDGSNAQWSSIGVLSLVLVCFLIVLAALYQ